MVDATRKLQIGRVFRDTAYAIRREAGLLVGVTLLLSLPNILLTVLQFMALGPAAVSGDPDQLIGSPIYWISLLVSSLLGLLMWACQLHIGIAALEGKRVELRDSLQVGARKLLPLFGVLLLSGLGVFFGALLLVIPGVILAVMWVLSSPVVVGETSNVIQALGRSRALTKGNRWRIFGLGLLVWVITMIAVMLFGMVGGVLGLFAPGGFGVAGTIVASLVSFVVTVAISVGTAALYVQLRELKGGGETVAQVFA